VEVNVGVVHEAIATAHPTRPALVHRDRRLTWGDVAERTRRLAGWLHDADLRCRRERDELEGWQSGQDHLGIYCHNGIEYLESMLGAFKARVAPFNVNYRYTESELRTLLCDAGVSALVFHGCFAPLVASVRHDVGSLRVLLQVDDGSDQSLLPGATWYEDAVAAGSADGPPVAPSADDLYILYTGGTTGRPKGVLWRQGDAFTECFGGSRNVTTMAEVLAATSANLQAVISPPFMHGAAHWVSFHVWHRGGTVFIPDRAEHLDPASVWSTVERERATFLLIVGDAFARPLLDELERRPYDLSSMTVILSGGAALSPRSKEGFLKHMPTLVIVDGMGSSEAGGQLTHVSTSGTSETGTFPSATGSVVLSEALDRVLPPGDPELGWLAKRGRLALGYLGDPVKTGQTYPVVSGVRYAVPGDRARVRADGTIEMHGRDSATINSGGEKIFAEEVEQAIKEHPAVYDCVVAGRPSTRWGSEVVAVVQLQPGASATPDELVDVAARRLARYKLPKAVVFVDEVRRSPAGKADYRWAREVAAAR
jgi:fatty-acyl-CoA synthase